MDWQNYTVCGIGVLIAAILAWRFGCLLRGLRSGEGCSSCASTSCPLRGVVKKKK